MALFMFRIRKKRCRPIGRPTGRQIKRIQKAGRKQVFREWQRCQDMIAVFKQLSPDEEKEITRRAELAADEQPVQDCLLPALGKRLSVLGFAYKDACELLKNKEKVA